MITKELIEYIKSERALSKSDDTIKQNLLAGGGWGLSDIEQAFQSLNQGETPIPTIVPKKENPTFSFILSFLFAFISGALIFTIFRRWDDPSRLMYFLLNGAFVDALIIFIIPAVIFASNFRLTRIGFFKSTAVCIAIFIIEFFVLGSLTGSGESSLAIFIYSDYIITWSVLFLVVSLIAKKLEKTRQIPWLIITTAVIVVLIGLIGVRASIYASPSSENCANIGEVGQKTCYERYALKINSPAWCYMTGDYYQCLKSLSNTPITFSDCGLLPIERNVSICINETASKLSDVSLCEDSIVPSKASCIYSMIRANKAESAADEKIMCSSLKSEVNKLTCYREWQYYNPYVRPNASGIQKCALLNDALERDYCVFANVHGPTYMSPSNSKEEDKVICQGIINNNLKERCVQELNK
jgi:hypothetical protein